MLVLENAVKRYQTEQGALNALDGACLRVESGEYVALVGASGSGKSTLMNVLGCLDTLTQGRYALDGREVAGLGQNELCEIRRELIGFVFQGFQLLPRLSAEENVAFPLLLRGVEEKARRELALAALRRVGLYERRSHKPAQLSGGQQQRVAIARALVYRPRLLLADEPTGSLDEESRREVMDIFRSLNEEGRTIVLITHDREVAMQAKRRCRVVSGKIVPE